MENDVVPRPWFRELTRYHWFVLLVAALGWLFDCLDQQIFILARPAAMKDLLPKEFDLPAGTVLEIPAGTQIDVSSTSGKDTARVPAKTRVIYPSGESSVRGERFTITRSWPGEQDSPGTSPFETTDQRLTLPDGVREAADPKALELSVKVYGNYATSVFLAGWATGGLFFGVLGDRIGRAKTMLITILMYSLFTGLSAISYSFYDFALYRFLTGLGVGGEFAVGVALVAEVMPANARTYALTMLQALSAFGNISAALINLGFGIAEEQGLVTSPWRYMFLVGAVPALLAVVIRRRLKEPERWQKVSHEGAVAKQLGSYAELFRVPLWRKHALLGLVLACSGVIGLWAVGFFAPDLIRVVQRPHVAAQVYDEQIQKAQDSGNDELATQLTSLREADQAAVSSEVVMTSELAEVKGKIDGTINGRLSRWASYTSMMINVGAFFGMFGFGYVAQRIGRRPTFAIAFVAAFISTAAVFWTLEDFLQIFWMVPIMGFCQLSLFAGYAIYFPELFPTHLRSTGTSFCYNVGRFVAASGPLVQAELNKLFAGTGESLRYAGVTMCVIFLLGLFVLPFLPETMDKPLPE